MKKLLFAIILMTSCTSLFARTTCPAGTDVKNVKLIRAQQNQYDPDYWNFLSSRFTHNGGTWNVAFGTFFRDVKSEKEALEKGQAYFDQAALRNPHPRPIKIRDHIWLCNYIAEGHEYYLSALNPPEEKMG